MQIIVIYILLIILFAIFKKVNAYDAFLEGVDESFKTVKNIFPNILAIIFAINVFINSGVMEILEKVLSNVNIVPEIIMQCFLKPISWSSSLLLNTRSRLNNGNAIYFNSRWIGYNNLYSSFILFFY